jgi:hypothetical protein
MREDDDTGPGAFGDTNELLVIRMSLGVPEYGGKGFEKAGLSAENGESFGNDVVQQFLFKGVEIERHCSPLALREYQDTKLIPDVPGAGGYDGLRSHVDFPRIADRLPHIGHEHGIDRQGALHDYY